MIIIREDKPNKLSGLSSLFISFKPIQDIINVIKSSGTYNYNPKTHEWEVLVTSLTYILDNLIYYDDIQLKLLNEDDKCEEVELKTTPKIKPFKHQLDAVKYGLKHDCWLLLDSPGLGKTFSLTMLAEELRAQRNVEHCLVICCINQLKTNWEKEINKNSNLDAIIIGKKINRKGNIVYTSMKERAKQILEPIKEFFVIINIESLREKEIVNAINNSVNKFDIIFADEVHKAKSSTSNQGKGLLSLKAKYKVAATGTLIMNSPIDAYTPLAFIGKEKVRNLTNFQNVYCVYDGLVRGRIIAFKNLDLLKEEIESCSLRRTKDLLDLPPKNIIEEVIEMNDTHRKFYDNIVNGVKEECDKINLDTSKVLALNIRLRQATSCPQILTSQEIISSKIERAIDLVEEITSQGDKVVIMSNFKEPVYQLEKLLADYNPLLGTGDMKDIDVSNNIDTFQNDDEHKVFICTESKCGTGITLTRARYMIMLDLPWTSALTQQCEDRIHRIGSKEPVFIYKLKCANTYDEKVAEIVDTKEGLSSYIVDDELDDKTIDRLKKILLDL